MEYLIIGQITRPHGLKGEIKVNPETDDSSRFKGMTYCYQKVGNGYKLLKIESIKVGSSEIIVKFDGINDRNAAELMRAEQIYIDKSHAINLPKGRYFISDLIGLSVYTDSDEFLGELIDVLQPGANDVYVVKNDKFRLLMPALKTLILDVSIKEKRMIVSSSRLEEVALRED